jgi:hypothetical protein
MDVHFICSGNEQFSELFSLIQYKRNSSVLRITEALYKLITFQFAYAYLCSFKHKRGQEFVLLVGDQFFIK